MTSFRLRETGYSNISWKPQENDFKNLPFTPIRGKFRESEAFFVQCFEAVNMRFGAMTNIFTSRPLSAPFPRVLWTVAKLKPHLSNTLSCIQPYKWQNYGFVAICSRKMLENVDGCSFYRPVLGRKWRCFQTRQPRGNRHGFASSG